MPQSGSMSWMATRPTRAPAASRAAHSTRPGDRRLSIQAMASASLRTFRSEMAKRCIWESPTTRVTRSAASAWTNCDRTSPSTVSVGMGSTWTFLPGGTPAARARSGGVGKSVKRSQAHYDEEQGWRPAALDPTDPSSNASGRTRVPAILDKLLRAGEGKIVRRLERLAGQVNVLEDDIAALTDEELREETDKFKARYAAGESLDDLLPEAFAVVREAARRTLGQRHYDVQLMGGAALHLGNIAEMKTGEGKTLVGTLPAYLNALTGKGVHIVTVNDYLAQCLADLMGRVYGFLGLTVGVVLADEDTEWHRKAYRCYITYGTNNEFGF